MRIGLHRWPRSDGVDIVLIFSNAKLNDGNLLKCKIELLYFQLLLSMPYINLVPGFRGVQVVFQACCKP